jgi:hypothetical protein
MDGERWALRKHARGAFSLAFIGWLLVFFDVTISGFDILSDAVGYLLVAIACSRLEDLHRAFAPVRWLAIMSMLLSVVMWVASGEVKAFWWWIAMIVDTGTIAWFCTALATAANDHKEDQLADLARTRRNWMIACSIASVAVVMLIPAKEMVFVLVLGWIVLICLFLGLIRRAGRVEW